MGMTVEQQEKRLSEFRLRDREIKEMEEWLEREHITIGLCSLGHFRCHLPADVASACLGVVRECIKQRRANLEAERASIEASVSAGDEERGDGCGEGKED